MVVARKHCTVATESCLDVQVNFMRFDLDSGKTSPICPLVSTVVPTVVSIGML